jgi:hypothetical protein
VKIMKNLEKIIAAATLSSILYFTGCATYTIGGIRDERRDYTEANSIYPVPAKKVEVTDTKNPDELLNKLRQFEAEVINPGLISEKYKPQIDLIMSDLKEKKYDTVEYRIQKMAHEVEQKKNSKDFLQQVRNFSYVKYEYISEQTEVQEHLSLNPINHIITGVLLAGSIFLSPFSLLVGEFDENIETMKDVVKQYSLKSDTKKVQDAHYRKILVNPYTGTEKVIDEFVPVNN